MAFSDPNLGWNRFLEIDNSSSGAMAGDLFIKIVFGLIFIAFVVFQLKQAISEFRQKEPKKDRFRLVSLIWSFLFYSIALKSLFNVNLKMDQTSIGNYLMEFYSIATIIGVSTGVIVIIRDIQILKQLKKNKIKI